MFGIPWYEDALLRFSGSNRDCVASCIIPIEADEQYECLGFILKPVLAEKVGQPVDQRVCGFENEGLWLNVDRGLAYPMRIELSRVVIFAHREAEPHTTPGDLLVITSDQASSPP